MPRRGKSETADELVRNDGLDHVLEAIAVLSAAVPAIGGPISAIASGRTSRRKMQRVTGTISKLTTELQAVRDRLDDDYVKSEDFEELLEETLQRARTERSEAKRQIYARLLAGAATEPQRGYDLTMRFMRTLETLQVPHFRVLVALPQTADERRAMQPVGGTFMGTLRRRLEGMTEGLIESPVDDLNDLRLTDLHDLRTHISSNSAEHIESTLTSYGARFVEYLRG